MKDTFKTFPKLVADPTTNEQNIIAWKKRIVKELRDMSKGPPFDTEAFLFGTIKIEEILGKKEVS